jgi:hypothetical protein
MRRLLEGDFDFSCKFGLVLGNDLKDELVVLLEARVLEITLGSEADETVHGPLVRFDPGPE